MKINHFVFDLTKTLFLYYNVTKKTSIMICTYEDWKVEIKTHSIVVEKFGQKIEYDIPQWTDIEHNCEYIYINLPDESMLQFKMEFDDFFVGDKFDKNGEFVDTIANYVFEEEIEEDFD